MFDVSDNWPTTVKGKQRLWCWRKFLRKIRENWLIIFQSLWVAWKTSKSSRLACGESVAVWQCHWALSIYVHPFQVQSRERTRNWGGNVTKIQQKIHKKHEINWFPRTTGRVRLATMVSWINTTTLTYHSPSPDGWYSFMCSEFGKIVSFTKCDVSWVTLSIQPKDAWE